MMDDTIACIYPWADDIYGYAKRVMRSPQNESRQLAVEQKKPPGRNSRESTAPLEDTTTSDGFPGGGLQLRFSHGPRTGPGFLIGTDPDLCDIVLPISKDLPTVGRCHCYLSFDAERRLILQDRSRNGTVLEYDEEGGEKRFKFKWIISGHLLPDVTKYIVVKLHQKLQFRIVVPKPSDLAQYRRNVDKFLQDAGTGMILPLAGLKAYSDLSTGVAGGLHTLHTDPTQPPILIDQGEIGSGGLRKVTRSWDVSTGIEYTLKKCHFEYDIPALRREASLMARASHEHLVLFHRMNEGPEGPSIVMDYVPLRALEHHSDLSKNDAIDVLIQTLSALEHLHGLVPPIIHRDIKPLNIFVQDRDPIYIKLGGFELSGNFVDTTAYTAPEFRKTKLTNKVDIWSLGVVILQYAYGLPCPEYGDELPWCQHIIKRLDSYEFDDLADLLSHMLVMDPKMRYTATECLQIAKTLDRQPSTPTPDLPDSFQSWTQQAGPESSTVKFHTRKPSDSSNIGLKRPRSLEGHFSESQRNVRPFQSTSQVEGTAILDRLREIQFDNRGCQMPDACLINDLCRHLERLKIYQLEVRIDPMTAYAILAAIIPAQRYMLAYFTPSDREKSIADLAQHLANVLNLQNLNLARRTGNGYPRAENSALNLIL